MNEVQTIQQEVKQFAGTIPTSITTKEQSIEATSLLVSITKKRKEVEKFFNEKFVAPAKALLKSHQDEAKLAIQPLNEAEAMLKKGLSAFQQAEAEQLRKEQEKINKQYERKVEKAIAKGKDLEDVAPPVMVQEQAKTTKTDGGGVTFRKVYKLEIYDEKAIPDEWMIITRKPNTVAITATLRAGMQEIPGCRLREEQEMAVRT